MTIIKSKFFKNFIILTLSTLIINVVEMLTNIYITNKIGTTVLGSYSLIMNLFNFLVTISLFGIPLAITKIVSETAIAAGTRRIEAVCGDTALKFLSEKADIIDKMSHAFKVPISELGERIMKLAVDNKNLQLEVDHLKEEQAKTKFQSFISKAQDINGGKLFITQLEPYPANIVKLGSELLASKLGESIVVLASVDSDKITYVVKVSDSFVKKGVNAGQIVSKLANSTGGKGGGRPQFAQGGGKDASNLTKVLSDLEKEIKQSL